MFIVSLNDVQVITWGKILIIIYAINNIERKKGDVQENQFSLNAHWVTLVVFLHDSRPVLKLLIPRGPVISTVILPRRLRINQLAGRAWDKRCVNVSRPLQNFDSIHWNVLNKLRYAVSWWCDMVKWKVFKIVRD